MSKRSERRRSSGRSETKAPDEVPGLIEQLGDRSTKKRLKAARRLGDVGDERALEPLVALALSDDSAAGDAAVMAVGEVGGGKALAVLQSLLRAEEPEEVTPRGGLSRERRLPSDIARPDRFEALGVLVGDPDPEVRRAAIIAVSGLRDLRGLGYAIAALGDKDRRVRRGAARALGKMGGVAATESLASALAEEQEPGVRDAIREALTTIGGERADQALKEGARDTSDGAPD